MQIYDSVQWHLNPSSSDGRKSRAEVESWGRDLLSQVLTFVAITNAVFMTVFYR